LYLLDARVYFLWRKYFEADCKHIVAISSIFIFVEWSFPCIFPSRWDTRACVAGSFGTIHDLWAQRA